jgi:cysteine desulfurase/selenocysteine lyase
MGIGVLFGKENWLERMPPFMGGGEMIRSVWSESATWNELPYKFEAGTPNVGGALGLSAAIDYICELGREEILAYEQEITRYALDRLSEIPGLIIYGASTDERGMIASPNSGGPVSALTSERGSVISFNLRDIHAHDVAQFLDREGVAVRAGHHCAQPIMRKLAVPAMVRASFSFYNTNEEIDRLVDALERTGRFFSDGI